MRSYQALTRRNQKTCSERYFPTSVYPLLPHFPCSLSRAWIWVMVTTQELSKSSWCHGWILSVIRLLWLGQMISIIGVLWIMHAVNCSAQQNGAGQTQCKWSGCLHHSHVIYILSLALGLAFVTMQLPSLCQRIHGHHSCMRTTKLMLIIWNMVSSSLSCWLWWVAV
jgi:hypothetical protein